MRSISNHTRMVHTSSIRAFDALFDLKHSCVSMPQAIQWLSEVNLLLRRPPSQRKPWVSRTMWSLASKMHASRCYGPISRCRCQVDAGLRPASRCKMQAGQAALSLHLDAALHRVCYGSELCIRHVFVCITLIPYLNTAQSQAVRSKVVY